jgi:hypothetical protein
MVEAMIARHLRWIARTPVLALALVVLMAQVGWARAAVCGEARFAAHEACKCCEEREVPAASFTPGDCCSVEESRHAGVGAADPAVATSRPGLGAPASAPAVTAARAPMVDPGSLVVEARSVGPPLWLRLRSLRL